MIKVLLADDHSIVRAGLRRLIEESGDMEVIAEAADGREALRSVEKEMPDVAVVDISMPGLDGLEVISRLSALHPKLPVLVLTMHEEGQYVVRAIEAGAMASFGFCARAFLNFSRDASYIPLRIYSIPRCAFTSAGSPFCSLPS